MPKECLVFKIPRFTFRALFATMKLVLDTEGEIKDNPQDKRVYELGCLLVPDMAEEDIPVNHGNLKELIVSFGGEIISDEMPKILNLAYPMQKTITNVRKKFNTAYFGWIKFFMDADKIPELKKNLDLNGTIVRFLILKTIKENTIASKRFVRGDAYHRHPSAKKNIEDAVATPINKEEIDREIDAMVAI